MFILLTAQLKAGAVHGIASVYFVVLSVSRPVLPLGQMSSMDDVILSQLQAISQLISSYPPSGEFCHHSAKCRHQSKSLRSYMRRMRMLASQLHECFLVNRHRF